MSTIPERLLPRAQPDVDHEGNDAARFSVVADEAAQASRDHELRGAQERLESLLNNSPLAVIEWTSSDYRIARWSDEASRMFGWTAAETVGRRIDDLNWIYPDDWPHVQQIMADMLSGKSLRNVTKNRNVRKDGSIIHCEWYNSTIHTDAGFSVLSLVLDVTERKRAEEAVQESQSKLQAALASMTDAVFISDAEGRFVEFNDAFATFHKFPNRDACAKTLAEYPAFLDVFMPDGTLAPLEEWAVPRALRGETATNAEYTLRRKDTGETWVGSYSFAPIRDAGGKVVGSVVVGRDITDRKRDEEVLKKRERQLRVLIENVTSGVALVDADGRFTQYNQRFLALFGLSPDADIKNVNDTDWSAWKVFDERGALLHVDDHPVRKAAQTRQTVHSQLVGVRCPGRRDLTWMLVSAAPLLAEDGSIEHLICTYHDITDLKQAERALRQNEARLRVLSRTASGLLATEDPQIMIDGLCREVMEHLDCQVFFNYVMDAREEKLQLNACAGISAEETRRVEWLEYGAAVCGCAARDGQRIVAEDILHSSDRRSDLVRSYGVQAYCCHPLVAEGKVIGTLSFGTKTRTSFAADEIELMHTVADQVATAMQRLASKRELSAANVQLQEHDRRKNEFLAMLSHELRNPLTPIRNSLFVLDRATSGGEQAQRAKSIIERQIGHLCRLVDDLLDVTRITRGKLRIERSRLHLNDLLARTATDYKSSFVERGVDLDVRLCAQPLWVAGDSTRIAQAVGNLLQNAAKFTLRGGHVLLALDEDPARAAAVIRVRDDGVGIDRGLLSRLFEPFAQADTSLDRSRGGLGLGLALVKGVAELHEGDVSAYSDGLGAGAEFVVRLPLEKPPVQSAEHDPTTPVRGARRILIIEDNADAADSLREALEFGGSVVEVAYEGRVGVEKARVFRPEVVLCDIGLPGMDGYEVARAFRADASLRAVHLVALSGYAQPEDVARAHEAGFERHMAKPPRLDKLEALLAEVAPSGVTAAGAG